MLEKDLLVLTLSPARNSSGCVLTTQWKVDANMDFPFSERLGELAGEARERVIWHFQINIPFPPAPNTQSATLNKLIFPLFVPLTTGWNKKLKIRNLQLAIIKGAGGKKKDEFTLPHTCSPLSPETDFPGFLAIWFFFLQTQETTVAMKKSCRIVLAVLLCPSISMCNQEVTGGGRGRGRGTERGTERRRKGRKEEEREKMLKYLRYKMRKP